MITIAHILLAVLLFLLVNWIGKHSIAVGYIQLSLFAKTDEAPAFNFVFRVLAPTVFLILTASFFYWLGLDEFVVGYYRIAIYYVLLRWLFNIAISRARLLNWPAQIGVAAMTCGVAYLVDRHFIATRRNLLPDPSTLGNELWLLVIIFLYQAANQLRFSQTGTIKRKDAYLRHRFSRLREQYGRQITEASMGDRSIERLAYSVMIYETFNRPEVYQAIERHLIFRFKRPTSLGPMQVRTSVPISDEDSVLQGVTHLRTAYAARECDDYERARLFNTLKAYNVRSDYPYEVLEIWEKLGEFEPFKKAEATVESQPDEAGAAQS